MEITMHTSFLRNKVSSMIQAAKKETYTRKIENGKIIQAQFGKYLKNMVRHRNRERQVVFWV